MKINIYVQIVLIARLINYKGNEGISQSTPRFKLLLLSYTFL